jgi:acetate kinase
MILVFNAGSSSLKFALFNQTAKRKFIAGNIERIGLDRNIISFSIGNKHYQEILSGQIKNHTEAIQAARLFLIWQGYNLSAIKKIGHRVVHGGGKFWQPIKLNAKIIKQLTKFNSLAPLHNPVNLEVIKVCQKLFSGINQYACFDTEWYENMPPENYLYSLPSNLFKKYGIRQFGFHGLSHEYVAKQAAVLLGKPLKKLNLITCHLGSGGSITAVKNGQAIETSMGFTPLAGLSMSSRAGDVDANIPLYLIRELKLSPDKVFNILNLESGWQALSGVSDFRQIMVDSGYKISGFLPRKNKLHRAKSKLVLTRYKNEVRFYIAGYFALLENKVDALVFTGAIGGGNADFRQLVLKQLFTGKVRVFSFMTDEEAVIANKIK